MEAAPYLEGDLVASGEISHFTDWAEEGEQPRIGPGWVELDLRANLALKRAQEP